MRNDPAFSVIQKLGGFDAVAGITGRHKSNVHRWTYPRERGGTGGLIPQREALKLLEFARANDMALSADDFIPTPQEPAEHHG